jgi:hypothetical protein
MVKRKYPENRKRPKDYLKDSRMVKIKQLPENAHLLKSQDKEYARRYAKEYQKLHSYQNRMKRIKGTNYSPTACRDIPFIPLQVKKGFVSVSFD